MRPALDKGLLECRRLLSAFAARVEFPVKERYNKRYNCSGCYLNSKIDRSIETGSKFVSEKNTYIMFHFLQ